MPQPRRILFKLSGEMLAGASGPAVEPARLDWIAGEIATARERGAQLALVVGAGNFVRGAALAEVGIDRVAADYMGMLGTVVNAMALAGALESRGVPARAVSAIRMEPAVEPYARAAAVAALDAGEVVVFGGGTGNPYFTTDTAASLRAVEIGADLLAKGTKHDGVFDRDPALHADARAYGRIAYDRVLAERLAVMDATAVAMCRDNRLPVMVFGLAREGSMARIACGETVGTLMA